MALDLSPERHGSKADPSTDYISGEEIMEEADRLEQVRKDAVIIAQEVVKELKRQEAAKETEAPETVPVETVEVIVVKEPEPDYTVPVISFACGFILGALVASLFFIFKIKRIKKERKVLH